MKFSDIAGMLDRDEMKVIVGGSGATGGGGATFCSGTALGGGGSMGGSSQSSFNGCSYSYAGSTSSYLGNGVSSGYTTSNPAEINAIYNGLTNSYNSKQPPTDCFFQCLGWISAMYGDPAHDTNYYANAYDAINGPMSTGTACPSTGGMLVGNALNFAGNYFNTVILNQYIPGNLANWINDPSGDHQLIATYRTPSGDLHAVAVLSIQGNQVYYVDPQNNYATSSKDISLMSNFYGINGECTN